jgi:hypothetical protein
MRRVLLSLAVVAMLAAACTGADPEADPSPTPSSASPSVSPTPTESSSAPPRAETAVEFIKRWITVGDEMQRTGDSSSYRSISRRCPPCLDFAGSIDAIYAAGGWVKTEGWEIKRVLRVSGSGNRRVVRAEVLSSPTTYVDRKGGDQKSFPGGRLIEVFEVERVGSSWQMRLYSEVPQ